MENLIYGLLIAMSAIEIYLITFTEEGQDLVSATALAIALTILILLIRIFYVQRKLKCLEVEGANGEGLD